MAEVEIPTKEQEIPQKPAVAGERQDRNPDGTFKKGVSGNPAGMKPGTQTFATKWKIFIEKVAKQNNMTPEEIDEQLLAVGFKKAKEGDYNFYRDVHDRVYGRPVQPTDITSGGEKITNDALVDELTKKLNDIYKGTSGGSDGETASVVGTEVPNQE